MAFKRASRYESAGGGATNNERGGGGGGGDVKRSSKKVMSHKNLMSRIRKTLYYGGNSTVSDDEEIEISRSLAEYASEKFSVPHKGHSLQRLPSYVAGRMSATPCSLLMALIYLDRINGKDPVFVRRITPSELFIVSVMISTKFYAGHDEEIYLSDWAEDGNMTEERLKQLELEFLCAIDWNIYISNEEFFQKLASVEKTLAKREGLRRGWLTYTELMQMLPSFTLTKFMLNMLMNNIAVMLVSYAAGVITIAGAFFLASQIPGHALHRKTESSVTSTPTVTTQTMPSPPPSAPLIHTRGMNRSCYDDARRRSTNNDSTTTTTNTMTSTNEENSACLALNVEAELLKLERQYREEAMLEDLRKRNNNERSNSMPGDPLKGDFKQRESQQYAHKNKLEENWLNFKNEYSDNNAGNEFGAGNIGLTATMPVASQNWNAALPNVVLSDTDILSGAFLKYFDNMKNCTTSSFWQILIEAATDKSSFVRESWLKFI